MKTATTTQDTDTLDPAGTTAEHSQAAKTPRQTEAKWQWLKRQVTRRLLSGEFPVDEPIWPLRDLAEEYGVSMITARRVYRELANDNLIRMVRGHGTFMVRKFVGTRIKMFVSQPDKHEQTMMGSRKHSEVLKGITRQVDAIGARLILLSSQRQIQDLEQDLEPGDLLVLSGEFRNHDRFHRQILELREKLSLHCVLPLAITPSAEVSTITENLSAGIGMLVEHALAQGHKRIGFLMDGMHTPWSSEKYEGYYATLKANGIALDFRLICETERWGLSYEQGLDQLLSLPQRPSAILVEDDVRALEVLRYCAQKAIKVPHDLAIAGLHDFFEASTSIPSLTSVNTRWEKQGELAIQQLLQMSEEKSDRIVSLSVQPELKVRESM